MCEGTGCSDSKVMEAVRDLVDVKDYLRYLRSEWRPGRRIAVVYHAMIFGILIVQIIRVAAKLLGIGPAC